jgi:hypothetical protein
MATISNKNEATFTDGSGPTGDILNVNTVNARVELPNGAALAMFSDAYTTLGLQLKGGTIAPLASTSAAAITNGATITTAGVGIARVAPASAVTGIILQAGTFNGQQVWVSNEAAVANTVSFASSGTSAVADGQNDVIPGLSARLYVWNSVNFLWYATPQTVNGTLTTVQSATASAVATNGTITTAGVGVARVAPSAAVTGIILQAGTLNGQQCWVVNEAAVANSLAFAASGTSLVADGVNDLLPGLSARLYVWDSAQSLWYATTPLTNGTLTTVQSSTSPAVASNGTITTAGVGVARVAPGAAVTGIILQAGTLPGQEVWVINEAAAANSVTFAASGTSFVADGAGSAIAGLTARKFVYDTSTSLWYRAA